MRGVKRTAQVHRSARLLAEYVSKADLLEAVWQLASLSNGGEGVDDVPATYRRLREEMDTIRANRGEKPVKVPAQIEAMIAESLKG